MKKYIKKLHIFYILFVGILLPIANVYGIVLDKTIYTSGERIYSSSDSTGTTKISIWNLDDLSFILSKPGYYNTEDLTWTGTEGHYSIIETEDISCGQNTDTYYDCKAQSDFVNEFFVTIVPVSSGGGGDVNQEEVEEVSVNNGPISYNPEINIISPKFGTVFSDEGLIIYEATDKNDLFSGDYKDSLGLTKSPVSIYYSSTIASWDHSLVKDEDKKLIANNLPAISSYLWKTAGLVEGKLYRIVIDAVDASGSIGESVSEFFRIDLTPPTFIVSADPAVAKNEDVTITVESSEELSSAPEVVVKQYKGKNIIVPVHLDGNVYKGVYRAIEGFDGNSEIKVKGVDLAGNSGDKILAGGTFSVGVNPPNKPNITSPKDNERVGSELVDIKGTAREDIKITATVNGVDIYKTDVGSDGVFVIKNVRLNKNVLHGSNIVNVVATDVAGLQSQSEIVHINLNSAPKVSILKPSSNTSLNSTTTINISGSDDNGDRLNYLYQIAPVGKSDTEESDWQTIADTPVESINFDTTEFGDGQYFIRVLADDLATTTISNIIRVNLKNNLPFISFDSGRRTVMGNNSTTVNGRVLAPENSSSLNIIKLQYSLNNGKSWISATSQDGAFNSGDERFSVSLKNLKEGVNDVLWKVTDSRGFVVRAKHSIVVDTKAPDTPNIIFPQNNSILNDANNESTLKGKFSFTLKGKSEPGATIYLEISGNKYTSKAAFDGTFRISGINLSSRGVYVAKVYAVDMAFNKSIEKEFGFVYDNSPKIVFTSPRDSRGVSKNVTVSWLTSDDDNDPITSSILSYRKSGGQYKILSNNNNQNKFEWDTSELPEGNDYEIKLEVSDGISTSTQKTFFAIDRTKPELISFEIKNKLLAKGGNIEAFGVAEDNLSGVEFVEYNFGAGTPWYKAKITNGYLGKKSAFSINTPVNIADGQYVVNVRAVDSGGNLSNERTENIVVDGTPPRTGSFEITAGKIKLLPKNRIYSTVSESLLSIKISLERDTKSASILLEDKYIPLIKDIPTGLWVADISPSKVGTSTIMISAIDVFGNSVSDKKLVDIYVSARNKVTYERVSIAGAKIKATQVLSDSIFSFLDNYDSEETISDENGAYVLYLPSGEWEISVYKDGYGVYKSKKFKLSEPTLVSNEIILIKNSKTSLWAKLLSVIKLN